MSLSITPAGSGSSVRPPQLVVDAAGLGDYTDLPTALAAVPAGGATVLLKRGTYVLTATLTVPAKTILRGEGMLATIIQAPLTNANALTVNGSDVTIEDVQIDGRYASQTNNGAQDVQCGVFLASGAHRCRVQRCWVRDTCGMGVSNVNHCDDLMVDGCRITNGGTAASQVQATPAPTTTTFAVAPGTSSNFTAGQALRIGAQAGTILSIQSVKSYVAAVTSTSVFTLNAGEGSFFANGQVIRVGPYSGTISTVVGDVVTLTGALATVPVIGQIVAIDNITLTGAITTPTAGNVVAPTGGYLKGVYVALSAQRPVIRNNYFSGWSQAIGLWYGAAYGLVEGNRLVANYGYEDTLHTTNRSALEIYPNNNFGGYHRVIGNLIDGSTHNCIEYAQGEVGTQIHGNILRNWAAEVGLGATGVGIDLTGQSGIPGATTDVGVIGNTIASNGGSASIGINIGGFTSRVVIQGNAFLGFSGNANCYPVSVVGGDGPSVIGNTFSYCSRAVFVNSTGAKAGLIANNQVWGLPATSSAFQLSAAGDAWIISGNSVDGDVSNGGAAVNINSGNSHRVVYNRLRCYSPVTLSAGNDCRIEGNYLEGTQAGNDAPLFISAGLRTIARGNTCVNLNNRRCVVLGGAADYTQVYDNRLVSTFGSGNLLLDSSSGTHNLMAIGDNHESTVTKALQLKVLGAQTVNIAQVTIAHGLGYAPTQVLITPTSNNTIWKSAASDATNVYLKADADGATAEVYVR